MTAANDRCSDCTKFASTVDSQISQLIIAGHIWSQAIRWRAIREQPSKQRVSLQLRWSLHHWISNCDGEEYNYQTDKASKPGSRWVGSTSVDPRLLVLTHCVSKEPSNSISSVTLSWRRQSRSRNDQKVPSTFYMGKRDFILGSSVGGASIPISSPNMTLCADLSRLTNCTRTIVTMDGLQIWVLQADLRCLSNCLFRERRPPGKELRPHTDTIISAKIGSRMSLETFAHAATVAGLWLGRTNGLLRGWPCIAVLSIPCRYCQNPRFGRTWLIGYLLLLHFVSRPVLCLVVFGIKVTGSRGEGGVSNKGALYDSLSHIFNDFSLCHPCQLTCDLLHCDYDSDLISHIMANCLIVGSKTIYYICNITVKQEYNMLWKHGCVVWSIVWPASVKPPDHYTTSSHVLTMLWSISAM